MQTALPDSPLDLNSELKQRIRNRDYPPAEVFSAEEVIVLTSFLEGARNPLRLHDEEYPDAFGHGLLDSETIKTTLEQLLAKGLLVAQNRQADTVTGFANAELQDIQFTLQSIARLTRKIADDLAGFGPYACHNSAIDPPLAASLADVRARLAGVLEQLKPLRVPYLAGQLETLGVAERARGLRLNAGPGFRPLPPPWINIDFSGRGSVSMNLLWGLPFENEAADYVYSSHVLEHIDYRYGVQKVLRDWYRVLAPGGCLRLVVPNIKGYIDAYANGNEEFFLARFRHNPFLRFFLQSKLEHVLDYAGAGMRARAGEFFEHKFGYDFETLSALLYTAGFSDVIPSQYMESADPALRIDDTATFSAFAFDGTPNSLFVEGRK